MTESNFTLGAFSPNPDGSGELVGSDDPLLASIAAPRQPVVRAQAAESVDRLLAEQESSLNEIDPLGEENFDLCIYLNQEEDLSKDRSSSASPTPGTSSEAESSVDLLSEELEASLEDMIQTAQMHPRSLQVSRPMVIDSSLSLKNFQCLTSEVQLRVWKVKDFDQEPIVLLDAQCYMTNVCFRQGVYMCTLWQGPRLWCWLWHFGMAVEYLESTERERRFF